MTSMVSPALSKVFMVPGTWDLPNRVFSPGNAQLRPVLVARVQGQEKTRYSDFPAARGHTSLSFVLCKVQIELFIIKRTNSTSSV